MVAVDPVQVGLFVAVVATAAAAKIIQSLRGGRLGAKLAEYRAEDRAEQMDEQLDQIQTTVEETRAIACENRGQLNAIAETMYVFHRSDNHVDREDLRDRLDIEGLPNDVFDESAFNYHEEDE